MSMNGDTRRTWQGCIIAIDPTPTSTASTRGATAGAAPIVMDRAMYRRPGDTGMGVSAGTATTAGTTTGAGVGTTVGVPGIDTIAIAGTAITGTTGASAAGIRVRLTAPHPDLRRGPGTD